MQASREMVEFLRAVHARPGGTGALLNLIRASEVRGATDLGAMADVVRDERLKLAVTRHAADEARHAYLLVRRLAEMGVSPRRLPPEVDRTEALIARCGARDTKRVYQERQELSDEETAECLIATFIAEADAVPKLEANYAVLAPDPKTQAVIGSILKDEHRHVTYLRDWIERFDRRLPPGMVAAARERLDAVFAELNLVFYASFEAYLRSADEACPHVAVA